MYITETNVLTRSSSGEPEFRVATHTDTETGEEYQELRRNKMIFLIGKTGAKCIGECEHCSLSRREKNSISKFSEIDLALDDKNKEMPKTFDIKTLETCDILNESGGTLKCIDSEMAIIEPKEEYADKKEGVLHIQNIDVRTHGLA